MMNQKELEYQVSRIWKVINGMIRTGVITEVSGKLARVSLGEGEETALLYWMAPAGDMKLWRAPTVGESAIVLSPGGALESGYIIAGIFNDENPEPSTNPDETIIEWGNGDHITRTQGEITIKASTITLDGDVQVTGNLDVDKAVTSLLQIESKLNVLVGAITLLGHRHPLDLPQGMTTAPTV